ncbi:MAG TPA: YggS family pyridoxal phosphate-dependent enzyme [Chloroflexia bacterium]|nr:YggS family pyridoxal phosphate-dependent enzyme [Chloroflexia bacterium]
MDDISANLETIRDRIALAAAQSGRSPDDTTLIAVTKTVPVLRIRKAVAAGVRHFGENRVQEAMAKFAPRASLIQAGADSVEFKVARDGITLHMIGSLQRNKARIATSLFDVIHSVDRVELVVALENGVVRSQELNEVALPVLIEVNVTGEASKSGVSPKELSRLADAVAECKHLRGMGLMTIARLGASEVEARHTFARLRELLEGLQGSYPGDWTHLSMGMSDDYQHAIREGATMVRLGRALFGPRQAVI